MDREIQNKLDKCREEIGSFGSVVVAFSGGTDSTLLLALAVEELGLANVLAAMGISPSLPQRERMAGRQLAREIGAELVEIETSELSDPDYSANPPDRCFYCKQDLFMRLRKLAAQRGFQTIAGGANVDDTGDYRPGFEAGAKLGVKNPLLDAGLTKHEIRLASKFLGLKTWDKPATACLASRIPYGSKITPERLSRVERAEDVLIVLGFDQCRVRDHQSVARIEVLSEGFGRVLSLREQVVSALKALGYAYVTLDLQGFRSGAMNEVLDIDFST